MCQNYLNNLDLLGHITSSAKIKAIAVSVIQCSPSCQHGVEGVAYAGHVMHMRLPASH